MALRKYKPSNDVSSVSMAPLNLSRKIHEGDHSTVPDMTGGLPAEAGVDIDLREVYFLIMHFLSSGPCQRTYAQFWNELLEHQLLPRRYHAWYSRSGAPSGDVNDNGNSFPLSYSNLVDRYPHIEKDHLVKLLKRLLPSRLSPSSGMVGGSSPNAADVPTLLGSGSFSLLECNRDREDQRVNQMPGYLRWPHMQADQVRGLSLREIGGGFMKHHRAPSIRAACYAIAKPSTMLQKMQIIKRLRGHQNAVYCAIFDRSGRYVITGSDDRLVKIWSMETAFCLSSCRGHEGDITDLAVSSNNAVVASASNDFIIRVWRLPDGMPISVLRGHTGAVTAIAFSPRPSAVYQLLSSSDDGTCRIWDAKNPLSSPRVYTPKPADVVAGKNNDSSSNAGQAHQILCCAYNANGTVFVSGSSDTYARVWNACKTNPEDSEQPNHEMDLLSGHENDVNYVQFSGCAVASRSSAADNSKEDNIPKFKNSWFTHDNIVTCSRDGSAIIWIPRSRRSHGKVGRWTRAYHLKVPPPPMPPQPHRGGPRQRFQPTPRGVNMIMWSLDNRFVLAAIMDCRICVWNASDGSLVHSLMGHSESTFVLDVHPFNPRIAMSAGYDGKTIIWDIWEGMPVRIYETGRFKLVDGKFSPDGTSIVLSDEVGQIFILATGQGESQKDAKYDQFFLGDYRPLIQDTQGYVLDQETQLTPYRRNLQDLLCDSSMIPYPESYQNMYQRRRLGALGFEWRPPSVKFVVGPADNFNAGDYQVLPIDPDRWVDPIPEFLDAIDWEQENEVQSDDNDSEYNANEEYSSEGEQGSLSISSSGDSECSADDSEVDNSNKEGLRRSKRKKHKSDVEFMTSSGRRVKRRNLDERDGTSSRNHRTRKSRYGKLVSNRKSSKSKSLRPQRRAARNALNLFSQITEVSTDGEEEDVSESESSESESMFRDSNNQSNESDRSILETQMKHTKQKQAVLDDYEDLPKNSVLTSAGSKRRLVLKFPVRDSKKLILQENTRSECHEQVAMVLSDRATSLNGTNLGNAVDATSQNGGAGKTRERGQTEKFKDQLDSSSGYKDSPIKWGEVKARSLKRLRLSDASLMDARPTENANLDGLNIITNGVIEHPKVKYECGMSSHSGNLQDEDNPCRKYEVEQFKDFSLELQHLSPNADAHERGASPVTDNGNRTEAKQHINRKYVCHPGAGECKVSEEPVEGIDMAVDGRVASALFSKSSVKHCQKMENNGEPISWKLRIKSKRLIDEPSTSCSKLKSIMADDWRSESDSMSEGPMQEEQNLVSVLPEEYEGTPRQSPFHSDETRQLDPYNKTSMLSISQDSKELQLDTSSKMINAVYRRSKSSRGGKNAEVDVNHIEENTSNNNYHNADENSTFPDPTGNGDPRTRSNNVKATADEMNPSVNNFRMRETYGLADTSKVRRKTALNGCEQLLSDDWKSASKMTVGLRSARNRRENYNTCDLRSLDRRKTQHPWKKLSWLMLSEHEEYYRYIPQQGDEVAYLKQGHKEYIKASHPQEIGPWRSVKGSLRPVEFCKVEVLDYSTLPGSGESCCKLTLEFTDPSSCAFGQSFRLTLPELVAFPDFLVERTRYDAAIQRNWTHRDKCQVWWRNEDGEGGSWWEGRILAVKPKCTDFPESPWERYVIQYRNDSSGHHLHSPWELHDTDSQWEHPCIDERSRDTLLTSFVEIEHRSTRDQDYYGIHKLNQVAHKSDFLNRFPVPLSFEVIRRRLESNYYRRLDAFEHDTMVMLSNAQTYFAKRADLAVKIRRLSELIKPTRSSV